jgi:hypothetical protein
MKYLFILILLVFTSCVDQQERFNNLKKMYPNCKVEPSTGLLQQGGYDFLVIDSNEQMIAVKFRELSTTKISSLRNVR